MEGRTMSAGNSISTPKGEVYAPSADVIAHANVRDPEAARKEASRDFEAYWAKRAEEVVARVNPAEVIWRKSSGWDYAMNVRVMS